MKQAVFAIVTLLAIGGSANAQILLGKDPIRTPIEAKYLDFDTGVVHQIKIMCISSVVQIKGQPGVSSDSYIYTYTVVNLSDTTLQFLWYAFLQDSLRKKNFDLISKTKLEVNKPFVRSVLSWEPPIERGRYYFEVYLEGKPARVLKVEAGAWFPYTIPYMKE